MRTISKPPLGLLEWLLIAATASLVLQLFPGLARQAWTLLDVRTWSVATWLVMQGLVLLSLLAMRFGLTLAEGLSTDRRIREEKEAQEKTMREIRERRKRIQGIKDGRRRRIM